MTDAQWYTSVTAGERRRDWFSHVIGILVMLFVLGLIFLLGKVT